ncbi:hypothetical protein Ocin01_08684 [Orchesella cincta]|uniref:Uncharacterized protein n=1 Tax=Orchesella cincta TaxID=48709 RepID=A0A1D2MY55_ORCCI|nr:hypothetical protein Ocin01_08684 [Orchesella cincta]
MNRISVWNKYRVFVLLLKHNGNLAKFWKFIGAATEIFWRKITSRTIKQGLKDIIRVFLNHVDCSSMIILLLFGA